jgi:hypothetical protein
MLSAGINPDDGTAASGKHHLGNPCQLFIGGLSHSTTEATLRERVSLLGELTAGVQVCMQHTSLSSWCLYTLDLRMCLRHTSLGSSHSLAAVPF